MDLAKGRVDIATKRLEPCVSGVGLDVQHDVDRRQTMAVRPAPEDLAKASLDALPDVGLAHLARSGDAESCTTCIVGSYVRVDEVTREPPAAPIAVLKLPPLEQSVS